MVPSKGVIGDMHIYIYPYVYFHIYIHIYIYIPATIYVQG